MRALKRIILPPAPFDSPELERTFLSHHAQRFAADRRTTLVAALVIWTAYAVWDVLSGFSAGLPPKALWWVLIFRVIGLVVLVWAVRKARGEFLEDEHSVTRLISIVMILLFFMVLGMLAAYRFPWSYVFYFTGLLLVILFVFGLMRMRVRPLLVVIPIIIISSAIVLYGAFYVSLTDALENSSYISLTNKSRTDIRAYSDIAFWAAMSDLSVFTFIGYLIANDRERNARATFSRERYLEELNRGLLQAQSEAETKTAALLEAKEASRRNAEIDNQSKSKFLAESAHDLRQPLQALSSYFDVAITAADDGNLTLCSEALGLARRSARNADTLLNDLTEISRLESGLAKIRYSVFDVADLIRDLATNYEQVAKKAGVTIRMHLGPKPSFTQSDRRLLSRVISNLLSNAIKYADPNKDGRRIVLLGVVSLPNKIRVDVIDNGIGIEKSEWQNIFKPLYQVDNDAGDREKGVGLGLSIVNTILPLLTDHRLEMRSKPGQGTRFSMEIPKELHSLTVVTERPLEKAAETEDLSDVFMFFIEDDEDVRNANVAMFARHSILTEVFGSAEEMEAAIPKIDRSPDIVVTDYRLPSGHTARDVMTIVREIYGADVPGLVLTGEFGDLEEDLWLPPGAVLHKPVSSARLLSEIGRLRVRDGCGRGDLDAASGQFN